MKHKKILSILMVGTMLCSASAVSAAEVTAVDVGESAVVDVVSTVDDADPVAPVLEVSPEFEALALENPAMVDENGDLALPTDGSLLDFYFPTELNGNAITKIAENAFRGCPHFRTVLIDASMEEIGANAFADCLGMEQIVLLGRSDADDMILGENWSGDAELIFELVSVEPEAPTEGENPDELGEDESNGNATPENGDDTMEEGSEAETPADELSQLDRELPAGDEGEDASLDSPADGEEVPETPVEPSENPEQPSSEQDLSQKPEVEQPDALKPEEEEDGEEAPSEPSEPDPDADELPEDNSEEPLPPEDESIEPEAPAGDEQGNNTDSDVPAEDTDDAMEEGSEAKTPAEPEAPAEPSEPDSDVDVPAEDSDAPHGEDEEVEGDEESEEPEVSESDEETESEFELPDAGELKACVEEVISYAKEAMPEYADVIDQVYQDLDIDEILNSDFDGSVDKAILATILTEIEAAVEANGGVENCVDDLVTYAKEAMPEYAEIIDQIYEDLNVEEFISNLRTCLENETVRDFILSELEPIIEENGGLENCMNELVSLVKEAMPEYAEIIDQIYDAIADELMEYAESFLGDEVAEDISSSESLDNDFDPIHNPEDALRLELALL